LQIVIVTRGGEGCAVYTQSEKVEVPGIKIVVKDTVGAGDAFSAGFLHKYFETGNLYESAKFANELGAYVASRAGAIPEDD
ncbi:MAG: PfkB family carbohydrate kinase, partial [Candidatus Magasanikbacteria bacterium]|nr:PfkB family carbohydrate kinase [Candidatus Magasanikbacteria bacterium]